MSNIENITFGVEIETTIPANAPVNVGPYHAGYAVEHGPVFGALQNARFWKAERDGSIQITPGRIACEFVSPVLKGEAGVEHLLRFVEWLHVIGAEVNASCGLHIHIGVESFSCEPAAQAKFVKILSRLVTRNSTALYAQTGTLSREAGTWCKRADLNVRKEITRACRKNLSQGVRADRYQLLNLANLSNNKRTVEFRCFAATLNADKILCHLLSVLLLCKVAAARKSLTNWDAAEQLSGTQSLTNLFKSRPTFAIVTADVFNARRESILRAGFEMAAKYDEAKAASVAASVTRAAVVTANILGTPAPLPAPPRRRLTRRNRFFTIIAQS